jgi:cephalosporin-C deacetylase-like acetyl esterase
MSRPNDLEAYWSGVDGELAQYPPAPELEVIPLRSTDFCTVYSARITSLGPYRLYGYISVPNGDGPFPGLLLTPHYGSVNHVPAYELRQRYTVLTLMHRGQRLADQPFAATYPGLLTLGIENPAQYIYRAIVADCLRGAEFLLDQPSVDRRRVGIVGDDLALITAVRRPHFAAVQASGLMFYRMMEACARTEAYPLEEVNDILRTYPGRRDAIARTVALFDPLHHVSSIAAPTVLSAGDEDSLGGPEWLAPLLDVFAQNAEVYPLTHEGRTDHSWLDNWLAERLGAVALAH